MTSHIITLSPQLANQIAAGEVVERPASIVKELVENSLDAGATHIEVILKNGGIDSIEVRDNGEWIAPEELYLAVQKYSTSKIQNLQDLYEVMTFGFRGEALASIASVSNFFMSSKPVGYTAGRSIENTLHGDFIEKDVAHEGGTTVRVQNLFYNTPARLNYLKQARTEYLKIADFLEKIALIYPQCIFSLEHDGKNIFSFWKQQGFISRLTAIMGETFSNNTLALDTSFAGIRISWVISHPTISFPQKTKQLIYVNRRIVQSPLISKAIQDAYSRYISHSTYPGYVLSLEVDPTQVDVNVHPRKMEVRFAQESTLFRSIYHTIEDTLKSVSLSPEKISQEIQTPSFSPSPQEKYYTGSGTKFKSYSPYTPRVSHPSQSALEFSQVLLWHRKIWNESDGNTDLHHTPFWKILGQVHASYILLQTQEGIMILDQHALAERVLYEKLASSSYIPSIQHILTGIWMHLDLWEYNSYLEHKNLLIDMGFEIELLSHQNIVIHAVPDFLVKKDIETLFRWILSDISEVWSVSLQEVRNKIWAYTACRSAVKFGDILSIFEMHALLRDASLDYSITCPHGRPVVYEISLQELQKKYDR